MKFIFDIDLIGAGSGLDLIFIGLNLIWMLIGSVLDWIALGFDLVWLQCMSFDMYLIGFDMELI